MTPFGFFASIIFGVLGFLVIIFIVGHLGFWKERVESLPRRRSIGEGILLLATIVASLSLLGSLVLDLLEYHFGFSLP